MDTLTFFFDKNTGKKLIQALNKLEPPDGVILTWHSNEGFAADAKDDEWMAGVAEKAYVLVSHDAKWHSIAPEAHAIKTHKLRCFYFPGAEARKWYKAEHFFRSYRRMIELSKAGDGPFIYKISEKGRFTQMMP